MRATGRRRATSAPPEHQSRKAGLDVRDYATRTPAPGGLPGSKRLRPQSDEQLENTSAVLKECCINRPDANGRERCKGERQCGEKNDRRNASRYCEGTWTTGGRLESCFGQRTTGQVKRELHCVFISFDFEKNVYRGVRCPPNDR